MIFRQPSFHVAMSLIIVCVNCQHRTSSSQALAKRADAKSTQDVSDSNMYIYAGTPDVAANDRSIFMITGLSPEGRPKLPIGTATNMLYPRCLLTAGHVVDTPEALVAWQGVKFSEESKGQAVEQRALKGKNSYNDLGILWLQNRIGDRYISSYSQKDLVQSIGMGHWDLEVPPSLARQSAGSPVDVTLIGYGMSSEADNSFGTRRTGAGKARWFSRASQDSRSPNLDGSVYFVEPAQPAGATAPQRGCMGDSGGPAMFGGKVFGVIKGGLSPKCGSDGPSIVTGLDNTAKKGGKNNWDWVHEMARRVCGKSINFNKVGPGKVSGSVQPVDQTFPIAELAFNGAIQCAASDSGDPTPSGWEDCLEKVSHTQTVTVTAVPDANATFSHWRGNGGGGCPCSNDPVCVIPYDSIGDYSEYTSIDGSYCTAVFQSSGGYGTTGGGYDPTGGSYGTSGGGYGTTGGGM